MSQKLMPASPAPALKLPLVGGGTFDLAEEKPENFTMVLFYRGHHCPVCKGYLGSLISLLADFENAGFNIVAISMNDEELAKKSVAEWGLENLRVAYGLTLESAKDWGLWVSKAFKDVEADFFTEPGLFWIKPDGTIYMVDISNMPWARPDLGNLLGKVPYALEHNYPPRGTYTV